MGLLLLLVEISKHLNQIGTKKAREMLDLGFWGGCVGSVGIIAFKSTKGWVVFFRHC